MHVERSIVLESGTRLQAAAAEPTEGLWQRVALLCREDRLLAELALRGGASHRQIGRLLNRPPGSITRSLQRLARRLHDPIVLALLHPSCPLSPQCRQIGVEHVLKGLPARQLAQTHDLPIHEVRRMIQIAKIWHQSTPRRRC
jgi:DNA-directed RNA polymerase specialized sigma24 family protein